MTSAERIVMKKILLFFVSLLLIFLPVNVLGAGNNSSTGAEIPAYANVTVVSVDPDNFDRSFNNALKEAAVKASTSNQYKIIISPGNYVQGHSYIIPGNTYIYAVGATITAKDNRVTLFRGDVTKPSENIIVEGGTWISTIYHGGGTAIRFMSVKNLLLKNITAKVNRCAHIVELSDVKGVTITGCTLSGNNSDVNATVGVQPKEAIQLDVSTLSAMPGSEVSSNMYNGKGCHKVLITENRIINCARGIGSHSSIIGAEKNPYTYISVKNNVIKNCLGEGIFGQGWKNTTISGNTIQKCKQSGIHLQDASNVWATKNKITDVKRYTGRRKSTYDPEGKYGVGIRILRCKKITVDNNQITKIYSKGIALENNKSGIVCKKNKIKSLKK